MGQRTCFQYGPDVVWNTMVSEVQRRDIHPKNDQVRPVHIKLLEREFKERIGRNRHYTLRSFARDLNLSSGALSSILNLKRPLTEKTGQKLVEKLAFCEDEVEAFFQSIREESRRLKDPYLKTTIRLERKNEYKHIGVDQFSLISKWYYLAILNLIEVKNFKYSIQEMAQRLAITEAQTSEAIQDLLAFKILKEENGRLIRTDGPITVSSPISNKDIQNYHQGMLNKAKESIVSDSVDDRDISGIVFPIDKSKMIEARKRIEAFRKEMADFLSNGQTTEVYNLSIQLFPLTQVGGSHDH